MPPTSLNSRYSIQAFLSCTCIATCSMSFPRFSILAWTSTCHAISHKQLEACEWVTTIMQTHFVSVRQISWYLPCVGLLACLPWAPVCLLLIQNSTISCFVSTSTGSTMSWLFQISLGHSLGHFWHVRRSSISVVFISALPVTLVCTALNIPSETRMSCYMYVHQTSTNDDTAAIQYG